MFLVAGYAMAAWLWWHANRRSPIAEDSFWFRLGAGLLFLLTINKLLDLREISEDTIRAIAKSGHWYEHRQPMQFVVAIVLPSVIGIPILIFLATRGRAFFRRHLLAVAGWMLLIAYLALRQSLEWKPALAVVEPMGYFKWRLALEAAGIVMVIVSAVQDRPGLE